MPVESPFTHITDLNASNPVGATDDVSEGDDHIRGLKTVLLTDFPNINGAVNCTPAELNVNDGVTGGTVTASKTVVVDASKDIGTFGEVTAATFTGTNVDGILGANTPATATVTTLVANTSVDINGTVVVVGTLDDDTMGTATDTTLATSESIKAYSDSLTTVVTTAARNSGNGGYAAAADWTEAHSQASLPDLIDVYAILQAGESDGGYSAGDKVKLNDHNGAGRGVRVWADTTNLGAIVGSSASASAVHKTDGTNFQLALTEWDIHIVGIWFA